MKKTIEVSDVLKYIYATKPVVVEDDIRSYSNEKLLAAYQAVITGNSNDTHDELTSIQQEILRRITGQARNINCDGFGGAYVKET